MSHKNIWRPALLLLTLAVIVASSLPANAKAAAGANGIRLSPVRTDLTVAPGQSQTVNITVTNITADSSDLGASINDFTARDESGQPAIAFAGDPAAVSKHGLKKYVSAIPNFTLASGQQKNIAVKITMPANAPGGGYFGAICIAPAGTLGDSGRNVYLAGSVCSLIIVTVPGDVTSKLTIASFDTRRKDDTKSLFTSRKGVDGVVRFQNSGDIQEQPFGKITLKNRSGKTLATYEINNTDPRGNVLPDSIRKFTVPLDKVGSFGIYKLEGNFGYGSNGQLLTASTTFYVIPTAAILGFIALVLVVAFIIFVLPRLISRYNQWVIRQARGRR
ncbi:MAG: hypothetical protein JWN38_916 [Candidatus Saccharibacteria bacterium]|nr:hypothetical protein [Candidatus Saccharibacteria bacterium]